MKKLIHYFLDNSLIVNLLTVVIIVVGIISAYTLKKETFPTVDFDVVIIRTAYPGSSAEDVEKLVTIPIEREVKAVNGIRSMNALSAEGFSIIYLEIEPDEDDETVLEDLRTAVDSVVDFPEEVEQPRIRSLNNKRRGIISVAVTGGNYDELRIASKRLRDRLEKLQGVASVPLDGYNPDEIRIQVNVEKLNQNELTLDDVSRALQTRNLNLSAGSFELSDGEVNIRTVAEFKNVDEIKNLVVRSNFMGNNVKIGDIASVERKPNPKAFFQRSNGERGIFLRIIMKENGDILKTVGLVKGATDTFFNQERNKQFKFRFVDDLSYYVERRLGILTSNGLLGVVLVFFCLLAFLNFSTSVVTSLGAPIAFMTSFAIMLYLGVSINLISMFALILVLGMLVDDSIIVSEHFYQKIEAGMSPDKAAREAAIETIKPVTATIITTIIAFGALFFMGGIMGKFLWSVPMVVIICLLASWLECFFILPAHLKDFCRIKTKRVKKRDWFESVKKAYGKVLTPALNFPKLTSLGFLAIFVGSLMTAKNMKFELFPGDDVRIIYLQMKGKVGTPIGVTDNAVRKLENLSLSLPENELKQTKAQIGTLFGAYGNKTGSHYGSIILYLTTPDLRERSTDQIIDFLVSESKKLAPDYEITVKKVQGGPPKGKDVEIELFGDSIDELKVVSQKVQGELKKFEGVAASEIDFETGKSQIIAEVDDLESKRLGLSTFVVARELRRAFSKDVISEIRESDEDIEIKLSLDDEGLSTTQTLEKLFVKNNLGQRVALSKVVKFSKAPGAFIIRRKDRRRTFAISATLDKEKITPVQASKKMEEKMGEILKNYPAVDFSMGGENKDTQESMMRLGKSAGIAMLLIFFVLVIMFQSFGQPMVIMSAIPLGLIGVVWSFKFYGLSLGFMAMMGIVGLVGVVVNDSIVLVTFINKKVRESENLYDAVYEGCLSRLRPVILTTVTTVAGLLPVAHAPAGDPFLKPMALSFAYGLLFATFVTLVFVPSLYIIYQQFLNFVQKIIDRLRGKETTLATEV